MYAAVWTWHWCSSRRQAQRIPAERPLARRVVHGKTEVVDQGGPRDALGLILVVTGAPEPGEVGLTERGSGCEHHPQEKHTDRHRSADIQHASSLSTRASHLYFTIDFQLRATYSAVRQASA